MGQIAPVFGSIVPSQTQLPLANNYLAFNTAAAAIPKVSQLAVVNG